MQETMKPTHKIIFTMLTIVAAVSIFSACEKDDNTGTPVIDYVRITRPESSDSLLIGAGQGQLIAIMGKNLGKAVAIWFNDRPSRLTPTYVNDNTILARVPSEIPLDITNKLKLLFSNGYELVYDFEVQINNPRLDGMQVEYVKDGDIAIIRGDYFYEPLTVKFEGGAEGQLESVTDNEIQVRVPSGAQPGQITVTTNFGEGKSNFWFRDNRNLLIHNDPYSGWWGSDKVVPSTDPLAINGNFTRMTGSIGAWGWTEWIGGREDALSTKNNLPDEAVLSPAKYVLKFEINTLKPFNGNRIKIMLGEVDNNRSKTLNWDTEPYYWEPPFDTKGKWLTVTIPFNEIVADYSTGWRVRPEGYGVKIWFHGPGALTADMAFDNLRVVPATLQ
jgi:hypothetical protein